MQCSALCRPPRAPEGPRSCGRGPEPSLPSQLGEWSKPVRGRAQPASCLTGRGFWSAKCQADGKQGAHSPRVGRAATAKGSCGRWERRTRVNPVACHTGVRAPGSELPTPPAAGPQEPLASPRRQGIFQALITHPFRVRIAVTKVYMIHFPSNFCVELMYFISTNKYIRFMKRSLLLVLERSSEKQLRERDTWIGCPLHAC